MKTFTQDRSLNISERYLRPGFIFGGWCLEKDTLGLLDAARVHDPLPTPLLEAIVPANRAHLERAIQLIVMNAERLGEHRVGMLGLTFKTWSDDLRASPALEIAHSLPKDYDVVGYDLDLLRAPELTGVNAESWSGLARQKNFTRVDSVKDVCDHSLILVLTKPSAFLWDDLRAHVSSDHLVIDLVGDLRHGRDQPCGLESLV